MIIGLAGKARCGKTTAAEYLHSQHNFIPYAFADPLKQAAMVLFGITERQAHGLDDYDREQIIQPWGISVREILQKLGTECLRNQFGHDFWIKRMEMAIDYHDNALISDVRFANEAAWIQQQGGMIIEIQRQISGVNAHASEQQTGIRADHIITNNGTLSDYYAAIENTLTYVRATT